MHIMHMYVCTRCTCTHARDAKTHRPQTALEHMMCCRFAHHPARTQASNPNPMPQMLSRLLVDARALSALDLSFNRYGPLSLSHSLTLSLSHALTTLSRSHSPTLCDVPLQSYLRLSSVSLLSHVQDHTFTCSDRHADRSHRATPAFQPTR